MGERQTAPGDLELLRAFVNTLDVEDGRDELSEPSALGTWLADHGLATEGVTVSADELRRAVALREALRAILLSHNGGREPPPGAGAALDDVARRAQVQLRFDEQATGQLEPRAGGVDGALGRLLVIVHAASADGTWGRLKACREHSCEWAFYDATKNHSRAWCDMQVCGNRAKARAYRRRHAENT